MKQIGYINISYKLLYMSTKQQQQHCPTKKKRCMNIVDKGKLLPLLIMHILGFYSVHQNTSHCYDHSMNASITNYMYNTISVNIRMYIMFGDQKLQLNT